MRTVWLSTIALLATAPAHAAEPASPQPAPTQSTPTQPTPATAEPVERPSPAAAAAPAEPASPAVAAAPEPGSIDAAPSVPGEPEEERTGPRLAHASLQDGFEVESADAQQSLRLGGLFSGRATVSKPNGGDTAIDADLRLARLAVQGRLLGPELTYFVLTEFEGTAGLLDMELTYTPIDELSLRLGRVRAPFGRQWIAPLFAMMMPDRSIVSDAFRPGRDTGITVESNPLDGKIEARLGAYAEAGDKWPLAVARLAFAPLGPLPYSEDINQRGGPPRFAIGLNGSADRRTPSEEVVDLTTGEIITQPLPDEQRLAGGVDLAFGAGRFAAFAEGYVDRVDPEGGDDTIRAGTFAQAGYFILPGRFEVAGRFNLLAPNLEQAAADGLRRYELGLSYYLFDGALKFQGRYAYNDVVGTPGALSFAESHAGDVQFVLAL